MAKKTKGPKYVQSPINSKMLNYREYYMSFSEKIFTSLLTFVAGGIVGYIFYGGLFKEDGEATTATLISNLVIFVVIGIIATIVFRPMIRGALKNKRAKKLRLQFRDMLESMASSLSSGSTIQDAFSNAKNDLLNQYSEEDYIVIELNEILEGIHNTHTVEEMITCFGERADNEDIQNFGNVISNCYRTGGDFRTTVCSTRDIISEKMAVEEEIATKVTSNQLQLNAMCLMPILLIGMIKLLSSDFAENLATPVGMIVTTIAIGMIVAAYLWGRKIIDVR